jgi:hypothetical protein
MWRNYEQRSCRNKSVLFLRSPPLAGVSMDGRAGGLTVRDAAKTPLLTMRGEL